MKSGLSQVVHIIPLGHEFDRAVRPFDAVSADHVYIISESGEGGIGNRIRDDRLQSQQDLIYTPKVSEYLKDKGIKVDIVRTNTFDLMNLLKTISGIIRLELNHGNHVLVNMSASGKLGAVAATMAGMALNVDVYYVHADYYASEDERVEHGLAVCQSSEISLLPKVDVLLPDGVELPVLSKLYLASENKLSASGIAKFLQKEELLEELNVDGPMTLEQRKVLSRCLMKVSSVMKKMEEKGYVSREKEGRKMMYQLTERGKYSLILSGWID